MRHSPAGGAVPLSTATPSTSRQCSTHRIFSILALFRLTAQLVALLCPVVLFLGGCSATSMTSALEFFDELFHSELINTPDPNTPGPGVPGEPNPSEVQCPCADPPTHIPPPVDNHAIQCSDGSVDIWLVCDQEPMEIAMESVVIGGNPYMMRVLIISNYCGSADRDDPPGSAYRFGFAADYGPKMAQLIVKEMEQDEDVMKDVVLMKPFVVFDDRIPGIIFIVEMSPVI